MSSEAETLILAELMALRSEVGHLREEVRGRRQPLRVSGKEAARICGLSWYLFNRDHVGTNIFWIEGTRKFWRKDAERLRDLLTKQKARRERVKA